MKKIKLSLAVAAVLLATAGAFATTSGNNVPDCDPNRPDTLECPTPSTIDCCFDGTAVLQNGPYNP